MSTPFVLERRSFREGTVHLLPSANVVLVLGRSSASTAIRFVMPHRTVIPIDDAAEAASVSPNFLKCLLGPPRRFIGRVMAPADHPMLAPFDGVAEFAAVRELLADLRDSLGVPPDEADFIALWQSHSAGNPIPTSDRTVERLCLRYAGQAPATINALARLARTIDADNSSGQYNSLGAFADASHYVRLCKAYTGRTPAAWRNLSQLFY